MASVDSLEIFNTWRQPTPGAYLMRKVKSRILAEKLTRRYVVPA